MAPLVACLLPARNAATDLPGWFESVERFADVVVALDDGSTDDTAEVLRANPLTRCVLVNPVRESYEGWDDAANRNRLLEALADIGPTWVMQLDADERIDEADGRALRRAVESGRLDPCDAYVFQVHRMIGDDQQFDEADLWVGRMFAHRPEVRFPRTRLHFVALPDDIPKDRWRRTTVRIQHYGSSTSSKRRNRREKYRAADPDHEFQASYDHIERDPGVVGHWHERAPDLPFVVHGRGTPTPAGCGGGPAISAVVLSQNDERVIAGSLRALTNQVCDEPFEIVVVCSGTDRTAQIVATEFPGVRLVESGTPLLPGAARNAGLAEAQGTFTCFPGSHIVVEPGYFQALLDAHRAGWAMSTPSFLNGDPSRASWANFFLDHSAKLTTRPPGRLRVEPSTASYRRDALEWAGGFVDLRAGEDTSMNRLLWEAGYGAWFTPGAAQRHFSPATTPLRLLRHHAGRGDGLAHLLVEEHRRSALFTRGGLRRWGPLYPAMRVRRIRGRVATFGTTADRRQLRRSLALVAAAAGVNWCSGWVRFVRRSLAARRQRAIR